ncbi:hypothetical protein BN3659_02520 [Alistipes sp. CHKCI003]|nr:hypothetical protein BN3659_02520 [Alistipes sp. CHKCI003]
MMPTRLVQATAPCPSEESSGWRSIRIIGITMPTSVASPAPSTCPREAATSTRKWPRRRGIVSIFTVFASIVQPFAGLPAAALAGIRGD